MKKLFLISCMLLISIGVWAQKGAPHTLRGSSSIATVNLTWKAPTDVQTMQWHTDYDYNGLTGVQTTPSGVSVVYMANRFDAEDLKEYNGMKIDSIGFFQFRNPYTATVQIYEDGKVVWEKLYTGSYKKNTWSYVTLDQPYMIKQGKELMIAVKYEHGNNVELVAIMDKGPVVSGKGNVYSYDGKEWHGDASGNFLVTAFVGLPGTEKPDGYNVYCNDKKLNSELIMETSATFDNQANGKNEYTVKSVFGSEEFASYPYSIDCISNEMASPAAFNLQLAKDNRDVLLSWNKPFLGANKPTYSTGTVAGYIYSSASAVRTWSVVEFAANQFAAYKNNSITAVNVVLKDATTPTDLYACVFEDGVIASYHKLTAEERAAIVADSWNQLKLDTPVKIKLGSTYRVGVLALHAKKAGVVAVDNATAIKGVSYVSSTSPKSPFEKSSPYWTAVSTYNFMISPEITTDGEIPGGELQLTGYNVVRDGAVVATVTDTDYLDTDLAPGTHTYSIIPQYNNSRKGFEVSASVKIDIPAEYVAPYVMSSSFEDGKVKFNWDTNISEIKHYGEVAYSFGLSNEGNDVAIKYGAKFTAKELEAYVGKKIVGLNTILAAEAKSLKMVVAAGNEILASKEVDLSSYPLLEMNIINFDTPLVIPAEKDLMFYYDLVCADSKSCLVFDKGPAVDGGALFNIGMGWNSFSLVASVKDNNIVIGAIVDTSGETAAPVCIGKTKVCNVLESVSSSMEEMNVEPFGIESNGIAMAPAQKAVVKAMPKAKTFRVYKNGKVVQDSADKSFEETVVYGDYIYYVTTVYENGWESPEGEYLYYEYWPTHKEMNVAPYDLTADVNGEDVTFSWQSPEDTKVLTKQHDGESKAYGLTKTGTVDAYAAVKFADGTFSEAEGSYITHIRYALNEVSTLKSCSVFVAYDENIIYEQKVDLETLKNFSDGATNITTLDTPVKVHGGKELMIGYHISYPNGGHPSIIDATAHVDGGDIISASGSQTYWSSLYTKSNKGIDGNHRISAVLKKADVSVSATKGMRAPLVGNRYNLYLNDKLIQEDIDGKTFTVKNASNGAYYVTCVVFGIESDKSNVVNVSGLSGVDAIATNGGMYYDAASQTVMVGEMANAVVYNASGAVVIAVDATDSVDLSSLPAGVYLVKVGEKSIKVVK